MKSELIFCFINIVALVSIIIYAQHHVHFDAHLSSHSQTKHAMLGRFLDGPSTGSAVGLSSLHLDDVASPPSAAVATPGAAVAASPTTLADPLPRLKESESPEKVAASGSPSSSVGGSSSHSVQTDRQASDSPCKDGEEFFYWKRDGHRKPMPWPSPWAHTADEEPRYITFEPDHGGWNNVRMAMETVATLAHATGRILVMPPNEAMYLISKNNVRHGFGDFFPIEELADGTLEVITMAEFLRREYSLGLHVLPSVLTPKPGGGGGGGGGGKEPGGGGGARANNKKNSEQKKPITKVQATERKLLMTPQPRKSTAGGAVGSGAVGSGAVSSNATVSSSSSSSSSGVGGGLAAKEKSTEAPSLTAGSELPLRVAATATRRMRSERRRRRLLLDGGGVVSQESLDTKNELRKAVWLYLRNPAVAFNPNWKPGDQGLVFPSKPGTTLALDRASDPAIDEALTLFQAKRKELLEYSAASSSNQPMATSRVIHLASDVVTHRRILTHFYLFLGFADLHAQKANMRFVRDRFHYREPIFCAAAKGVRQLEREAANPLKPFPVEPSPHARRDHRPLGQAGSRGYSSLHIRRGDFQYKQVKMACEDILESVKDVFLPGELLYISTDESDKSFFEPFRKAGFSLRFLDDVAESVGLSELADPNFVGMVEQVIASQGRVFVGTWYSTFTGYINRLRGYYGLDPTKASFYFWEPKKTQMQTEGPFPKKFSSSYAREWAVAWENID